MICGKPSQVSVVIATHLYQVPLKPTMIVLTIWLPYGNKRDGQYYIFLNLRILLTGK